MPLPYSWAMRWKLRSAPERSTWTAMPGVLGLEGLGDLLGGPQLDRGVPHDLGVLGGRRDQRWGDRGRGRRRGLRAGREQGDQRRRHASSDRSCHVAHLPRASLLPVAVVGP